MIRNAWNYLTETDLEWKGTCAKKDRSAQNRLLNDIPPWEKVICSTADFSEDYLEIYTVTETRWN